MKAIVHENASGNISLSIGFWAGLIILNLLQGATGEDAGWRGFALPHLQEINKFIGNPFNGYLSVAQLGSFLPLLILGPLSEEIGWRGYALERLQMRWNALTSSLIVGFVWALWHLPLFMMVGTSQHESGVPFLGFLLKLTASSILYTYAAQVLASGAIRSPLYNLLECLPYVVMASIVVAVCKPQTSSRPQKTKAVKNSQIV
jgi:membrane protease YdiL (CAAX protease family)